MTSVCSYLWAYLAALATFLALDGLWLGVIARDWYKQGIGHLMADSPNFIAAAVFYLVYVAGLLYFAVLRRGPEPGWTDTLVTAGLFGALAYATYDLTNLATLRQWPLGVALADIGWGALASTAAAAAAKACLDWQQR